jgi:hypothetical protein
VMHEALSLLLGVDVEIMTMKVAPAVRPPFCCQREREAPGGRKRRGRRGEEMGKRPTCNTEQMVKNHRLYRHAGG